MHFRLVKTDDHSAVTHEGVMPPREAPEVVTWGQRAFKLIDKQHGLAIYAETTVFPIAAFGSR